MQRYFTTDMMLVNALWIIRWTDGWVLTIYNETDLILKQVVEKFATKVLTFSSTEMLLSNWAGDGFSVNGPSIRVVFDTTLNNSRIHDPSSHCYVDFVTVPRRSLSCNKNVCFMQQFK